MSATNLTAVREQFAQRIQREAGIGNPGLIQGLATVPREDFVGPGPWKLMRPTSLSAGYELTSDADAVRLYDNVLVALDAERTLNNGEPAALLRFLDILGLTAGDRFLHVGCGVGYYTAIATFAVGPDGRVTAVEIDSALAQRAERNLAAYPNVNVLYGDGASRLPGPFNAIFVNAGCTDIHASWMDELATGGRLLVPMTVPIPNMPGIGGGFLLMVKRTADGYGARFVAPMGVIHCVGSRTESGEASLRRAFAAANQYAVRRLRRDAHGQSEACWLHEKHFCLSLA